MVKKQRNPQTQMENTYMGFGGGGFGPLFGAGEGQAGGQAGEQREKK